MAEAKDIVISFGPPVIAAAAKGPTVITSNPTAATALFAVNVTVPRVTVTRAELAALRVAPFSIKTLTATAALSGLFRVTSNGTCTTERIGDTAPAPIIQPPIGADSDIYIEELEASRKGDPNPQDQPAIAELSAKIVWSFLPS
tara:strand:- start:27458 stop:27889 length:432 start_codon:yes stop_codon:yes gene_type:complete